MTQTIFFESERREMIEHQLRRRGIHDSRVLDAMFQVPRHEFVEPALVSRAYKTGRCPSALQKPSRSPTLSP